MRGPFSFCFFFLFFARVKVKKVKRRKSLVPRESHTMFSPSQFPFRRPNRDLFFRVFLFYYIFRFYYYFLFFSITFSTGRKEFSFNFPISVLHFPFPLFVPLIAFDDFLFGADVAPQPASHPPSYPP